MRAVTPIKEAPMTTITRAAESVRSAVEQANARFVEAFNRRDFEAVASGYTPDATVLPPNADMVEGREAIQRFWSEIAREPGVERVELRTVKLEPAGDDRACEVGRYRIELESGDEDHGKYMVFWKRDEGGAWRLHLDGWSSDLPHPGD